MAGRLLFGYSSIPCAQTASEKEQKTYKAGDISSARRNGGMRTLEISIKVEPARWGFFGLNRGSKGEWAGSVIKLQEPRSTAGPTR